MIVSRSRCSPLTKSRVCISRVYLGIIPVVHADLMGDKELAEVPDFKPPKSMGMGKWFTYLKNVISLSPVPKGSTMKLGEVPEGVKVLGGTYAIDGDAVKFSHMDQVPGATPEIEEVLASVGA